jgi:dTDP-4-amino-4,6-dideoxygalactose transaminase
MPEVTLLTADPGAGFRAHADEIRAAIERVLASGQYILGPEVAAFEQEFAAYQGGGETVAVANGTEAIELALRASGVTAGDRVATVANTVSATAAAIQQIGAVPVWVEIEPATMLMSPAALEDALGRSAAPIKAIVPVHLYGQLADLAAIMPLARRHGAKVVEDCAQAHGAGRAGRRAGTWGDAAAFSFYPTKNLGAIGDGGAVFTAQSDVAERVRLLRQYGWKERYVSAVPGRNSRLDELQAAILRVKLRHLEAENAIRRSLAARYDRQLGTEAALARCGLRLPAVAADSQPAWHQFAVRLPGREGLREHLAARGIRAAVLYPVPLHRQPAYARPELVLPETERACAEVLCLPLHPALAAADIDRVCGEIIRWAAP